MADKTYLPGTIHNRTEDLLKERKMTQAELAEKIGSKDSTLSRFISGKTDKLSDENIVNIAKVFGVSTDFLLGETDDPSRKNYDIGELGLSTLAAKNLYTRKVNAEIVNRMLENPRFPRITQMIYQYFNDTYAVGINARNQLLDMENKYMSAYAQDNPDLESGLQEASAFIKQVKINPHEMDLEKIRSAFMAMLREIKKDMDEKNPVSETATKEIVAGVIQNTEKGSEMLPDKPIITIEQLGGALAEMTGAFPGQAEAFKELIQNFLRDFTAITMRGLNEDLPDESYKPQEP